MSTDNAFTSSPQAVMDQGGATPEDVIQHSPWSTVDPYVMDYCVYYPVAYPYDYGDWKSEQLSWKETCFLFAGLTDNVTGYVSGPDAIELLRACTCTGYKSFPVGRSKHTCLTDDDGNIVMHGLALRVAEDRVWLSTIYPWVKGFALMKGGFDVEFEETSQTMFNFQLGGPRSLEVVEAACKEDLHDIPFLGFRDAQIDGRWVRILRMTMSGTLGYEIHGLTEDAKHLYQKVLEAGEPFGIRRMGWTGYFLTNTENAMPNESSTFTTSGRESELYMRGLEAQGYPTDLWPGTPVLRGSSSAAGDMRKYYRNPIELGWGVSVTFDHDFPGKEVLRELKANPRRKTVTLVWDVDDLLAIQRSLYEGEPLKQVHFPINMYNLSHLDQDDVFDAEGNEIGVSSMLCYSAYERKTISIGTLDVAYVEPGTEVYVLWGEPGERQMKVRATVERFPILDLPSNKDYPIEEIPHYQA